MKNRFINVSVGLISVAVAFAAAAASAAAETLVFDQPETAGMSGLRAHWNKPLQVAETQRDSPIVRNSHRDLPPSRWI